MADSKKVVDVNVSEDVLKWWLTYQLSDFLYEFYDAFDVGSDALALVTFLSARLAETMVRK